MPTRKGDILQIIWRNSRPEYAVLRWDEYERLRTAAGESAQESPSPLEREEAEEAADVSAAEAVARRRARQAERLRRESQHRGRSIEQDVPFEVVERTIFDGATPLRAWREYRGMKQTELADRAGLSRAYVAQIEAGKRAGTTAALRALANVLDVLVDDLVLPDSAEEPAAASSERTN